MGILVRLAVILIARTRFGRWIVGLFFLAAGLLVIFDSTPSEQDATTTLGLGAFALLIGMTMLFFAIMIEVRWHKAAQMNQTPLRRAERVVTRGQVLPLPPLPKTPLQGASADDLFKVEQYARQLAELPWGEQPMIATVEDAYPLFYRTVGRVREVTGNWRELSEPVDIFVGLPKPLCYVGAAEVMRMLSYLRGTISAPVGLLQGLRFVAQAQYIDPDQPDALVARINLLVGYHSAQWIDLAEETLAILKLVAPHHPRLPDAESNLLIRQNRLSDALVCIEHILAYPPTPEEEHVALSRKARILDRLQYTTSALAAYDVVNQRYPDDPWAWHNKSLLLIKLNRLDEAWVCNQRALSLMPFGQALKTREGLLARFAAIGTTLPTIWR